ncbi:MAG: hypothetical protein ACYC67_24195, partial [Prosthecobacter sp.]
MQKPALRSLRIVWRTLSPIEFPRLQQRMNGLFFKAPYEDESRLRRERPAADSEADLYPQVGWGRSLRQTSVMVSSLLRPCHST